MDDGVESSGMVQYAVTAATTTLKFYALPVQ
jgi:hypothetical protein